MKAIDELDLRGFVWGTVMRDDQPKLHINGDEYEVAYHYSVRGPHGVTSTTYRFFIGDTLCYAVSYNKDDWVRCKAYSDQTTAKRRTGLGLI